MTAQTPRRRTLLVAAISGLLATGVVLTLVLQPATPPVASSPTASSSPDTALGCPPVAVTRSPRLSKTARPKVLIFGDSYTEGFGADPKTDGFAFLVGAPLGWRVKVDGVGGTGYVNPGPKNQGAYRSRLERYATSDYDLVVIEGSSNDSREPIELLQPALQSTMSVARMKFPKAQIVMMGPLELHTAPSPERAAVNSVLALYAAASNLVFINPMCERWFLDEDRRRLVNPTNGHPNSAGYAQTAELFVRDIRRLAVSPTPKGTR